MIVRFIGTLFSAFALLFLAGAVVVVGAVWYYGRDLPDYDQLADYKPPQSSLVLDDDGAIIARFARERRAFETIDEIPDLVKNAFISAEDKNFYDHSGIDPVGIAKAMVRNVKAFRNGGRMSGASTITQQVVKNMLLTNERSISRKVREAVLAVQIERELSKDRILEIYLNQIYLGARSYGVGAASQTYFGKALEYLSPEEAAYLAALPKAPSALHPERNAKAALARRNYVLGEMVENGHLSDEDAQLALSKPLETRLNDETRQEESYDFASAYMIEEVRSMMLGYFENEALLDGSEKAKEAADADLYGGGLKIRTTLDREMQTYAARALREGLHTYSKRNGYRGPLGTVDADGRWRDELAAMNFPKDLGDWQPGVVLTVRDDKGEALVGMPGRDKAIKLTLDAVTWARFVSETGERGPEVKKISHVLARGDVIYVTPGKKAKNGDVQTVPLSSLDDPAKTVWGLRQLPEANGAVVAMEPDSGRVLAMHGGISVQHSKFNRATQAQRQPGSAFKPIVYAAAMDNGYTPASIVLDAPVTVDQGNGEPLWQPKNYSNEFYGPIPLRIGLEKSRNLITVRVAQDVGMDVISDYARRFGIYDRMPPLISYSLGAGETSLLRMATAYSMLVNGGKHIAPRFVESLKNDQDEDVPVNADWMLPSGAMEPMQVIDPVTAYQTVSLMEGVVLRGTATRLQRLGFPVAGKTGTTNDARDAWFVGFTPDLVFGCYIGFDTPKSLGKKASGGAICGPVFEQFMREAMADRTPRKFEVPEGVSLVKIDRNTGDRVGDEVFGNNVIWEAFRVGTEPGYSAGSELSSGGYLNDYSVQGQGVGSALQPDMMGNSAFSGNLQGYQQPATNDPYNPNQGGVAPLPRSNGTVSTQPIPSGNEPLIRFDANGQMVVSQDPAITVEPAPGVFYRQPEYAPSQPEQPFRQRPAANTAPSVSSLGNSAQGIQGGGGLY